MMERVALIGFGEAAQAFAPDLAASFTVYDRKTGQKTSRPAKVADYARFGVTGCDDAKSAVLGASGILSLVSADQALAAVNASPATRGQFWFDMNSVAPQTKQAAEAQVIALDGRYLDVAVMSPVHPKGTGVPLLVAGADAIEGANFLQSIGFLDVTVIPGPVGTASSIKMIRSVMIKGIEALSAECVLAAEAAGVRKAVIASLDASWPGAEWSKRFDYNLDRMIVHGARRAAEMDEVVRTLDALGTGSAMSRGTVVQQRDIGTRGIAAPQGLDAKLEALRA